MKQKSSTISETLQKPATVLNLSKIYFKYFNTLNHCSDVILKDIYKHSVFKTVLHSVVLQCIAHLPGMILFVVIIVPGVSYSFLHFAPMHTVRSLNNLTDLMQIALKKKNALVYLFLIESLMSSISKY